MPAGIQSSTCAHVHERTRASTRARAHAHAHTCARTNFNRRERTGVSAQGRATMPAHKRTVAMARTQVQPRESNTPPRHVPAHTRTSARTLARAHALLRACPSTRTHSLASVYARAILCASFKAFCLPARTTWTLLLCGLSCFARGVCALLSRCACKAKARLRS
eukprot:2892945-Pleurochrysis_carterae.AAC.2